MKNNQGSYEIVFGLSFRGSFIVNAYQVLWWQFIFKSLEVGFVELEESEDLKRLDQPKTHRVVKTNLILGKLAKVGISQFFRRRSSLFVLVLPPDPRDML